MFSVTELRDALEHSASRAHERPRADEPLVAPATRRAGWLMPAAAAAAGALVAAGALAVSRGGSSGGPARPAAESHSSPTTTAARPHAAPLVPVNLVDRAVAGVDAEYTFGRADDGQTGSQVIRRSLGDGPHDGAATLDVMPARSVDPHRLEQGTRVKIAGTTGWYSALKLYPLDGSTGPGSDKWLPHWGIAFRAPSGDWAFAWIELATDGNDAAPTAGEVSVRSVNKIVRAYDGLKIQWRADAARQPLHLSYLPRGVALRSASYSVIGGRVTNADLGFGRGDNVLDVQLLSGRSTLGPLCMIPASGGTYSIDGHGSTKKCLQPPTRKISGERVTVDGSGFSRAEQQRVLEGVAVAAAPKDYVGFVAALTP